MFIDNLTIALGLSLGLYLLLPLWFGSEIWRVQEECEDPAHDDLPAVGATRSCADC